MTPLPCLISVVVYGAILEGSVKVPLTKRSIPLVEPEAMLKIVPPAWVSATFTALISEVLLDPVVVTPESKSNVPQIDAELPLTSVAGLAIVPPVMTTLRRWVPELEEPRRVPPELMVLVATPQSALSTPVT